VRGEPGDENTEAVDDEVGVARLPMNGSGEIGSGEIGGGEIGGGETELPEGWVQVYSHNTPGASVFVHSQSGTRSGTRPTRASEKDLIKMWRLRNLKRAAKLTIQFSPPRSNANGDAPEDEAGGVDSTVVDAGSNSMESTEVGAEVRAERSRNDGSGGGSDDDSNDGDSNDDDSNEAPLKTSRRAGEDENSVEELVVSVVRKSDKSADGSDTDSEWSDGGYSEDRFHISSDQDPRDEPASALSHHNMQGFSALAANIGKDDDHVEHRGTIDDDEQDDDDGQDDDDQDFRKFSSFLPASGEDEGGGRALRLPIDGSDKDGAEGTLLDGDSDSESSAEGGGGSESTESDGGYSGDPPHAPSEDERQEIVSGNASDSSNEYSLESVS
jgi:hypothetical protein